MRIDEKMPRYKIFEFPAVRNGERLPRNDILTIWISRQAFHEVTPLSDKELIQNVILAAKNALLHSDDFKDNFVSSEFK